MTSVITQTHRIYLRPFLPEDSIHLYTMNNDDEVLRYTASHPFASLQEANTFVRNYKDYEKYGMGRWAVLRKEDNSFLGWCGLKYHPEENIVDLGYRFYKKFWGYGYATEAAEAALHYGFSTLKLPRVFAHTHKDNNASKNVLKKCGLHFTEAVIYEGLPVQLYVKNNPYITVKAITAKETYPIRHAVLRQGKPIASCAFEGDDLPATLHLGIFFKDTLIGAATFLEKAHPLFTVPAQIQLRGMGVLPDFHGKGIGGFLIKKAEHELLKRNTRFIWMNARIVAVSFYKKLGYTTFGDIFTIAGIGPHYVMIKHISTPS